MRESMIICYPASAGHSQGTTTLLAALSSQPELQDCISVAVLLAPVGSGGHFQAAVCHLFAPMQGDKKLQHAIAGSYTDGC